MSALVWAALPLAFCSRGLRALWISAPFSSALPHLRTARWPVWHLGCVYWLLQFSECLVCCWALDPCMHTWGGAQKFTNTFMGLPRRGLLGTLRLLRPLFPILGLLHVSPRASSLRTREKLKSPAVCWCSKFCSSSLVCLLWFLSSSNGFSIYSVQELWVHSG